MIGVSEVRAHASAFGDRNAATVLRWAVETFRGRLILSVSFGGSGLVLAHMLAEIDRSVPVLFLDTGLLFPETYTFKDEFAARYRLNVIEARAVHDPGPLYETDVDGCCAIRKVEPMRRSLEPYDAWVSALRRDQGASRRDIDLVEYHETDGRPLVKIHPLAGWSRHDVQGYIREHALPTHPLLERGYKSLGCWPCTRPVGDDEPERAGRWGGSMKTECGIHTFTTRR